MYHSALDHKARNIKKRMHNRIPTPGKNPVQFRCRNLRNYGVFCVPPHLNDAHPQSLSPPRIGQLSRSSSTVALANPFTASIDRTSDWFTCSTAFVDITCKK